MKTKNQKNSFRKSIYSFRGSSVNMAGSKSGTGHPTTTTTTSYPSVACPK